MAYHMFDHVKSIVKCISYHPSSVLVFDAIRFSIDTFLKLIFSHTSPMRSEKVDLIFQAFSRVYIIFTDH